MLNLVMTSKKESESEGEAAAAATVDFDSLRCQEDVALSVGYRTKQLLVNTFGFDPELAIRAVEAIDDPSDVTLAYNWILDTQEGVEDKGGPVVPKTECPHLRDHVKVTTSAIAAVYHANGVGVDGPTCDHVARRERATGRLKCDLADDDDGEGNATCPAGENWTCLECGVVRCSRYVNGHALAHWETTKAAAAAAGGDGVGHCVAVSLSDLSVWCYACRAYLIDDETLGPVLKQLETLKFAAPTATMTTTTTTGSG